MPQQYYKQEGAVSVQAKGVGRGKCHGNVFGVGRQGGGWGWVGEEGGEGYFFLDFLAG